MNHRHTFQVNNKTAEYYLAVPTVDTQRGVLVLHAWWGLTSVFTAFCDRLAEAGFVALAPDLYHGRIANTREQAESIQSTMDDAATNALINRAVDELQARPEIQGRPIGVVGFSMGGFWALTLDRGVAALVTYYGGTAPEYVTGNAPILGHFAERDEFEPLESVQQLEQNLKAKGLSVNFHYYPGTQHWFCEDNQPGYYDPAATESAWQRTLSFLNEHLT
jgi:carboxymethylenebutenolidase